ncbi:13248_t:CDS:2, partial [Entrophospora sp. SA101]
MFKILQEKRKSNYYDDSIAETDLSDLEIRKKIIPKQEKKIEQTNQPEPEDDRSVYNEIDDTLMTLWWDKFSSVVINRTSYLPDLAITDDSFLLEVYDKDAITQVRLIARLIVSCFQSYLATLIWRHGCSQIYFQMGNRINPQISSTFPTNISESK